MLYYRFQIRYQSTERTTVTTKDTARIPTIADRLATVPAMANIGMAMTGCAIMTDNMRASPLCYLDVTH